MPYHALEETVNYPLSLISPSFSPPLQSLDKTLGLSNVEMISPILASVCGCFSSTPIISKLTEFFGALCKTFPSPENHFIPDLPISANPQAFQSCS